MAFTLTIVEGKGAGERYEFDASDVTIGRGVENDVVLNDPGVSRRHARIGRDGPRWLLADNGSSNGTELNGRLVSTPAPVKTGDRIGVGPITFEFEAAQAVVPDTRVAAAPRAAQETRVTAVPQLDQQTRISSMPAAPRAVAPRAGGPARAPRRPLSRNARIGLVAAGALGLTLIGYGFSSGNKSAKPACPDAITADDRAADFSFGRGEVDVDCGGKVVFGFNVPPRTRALLHYVPLRVTSPSEVELRLNNHHVGWVPAAGSRGEPQVLTLPQEALAGDGHNLLAFNESLRGKDWGVTRVRVELLAVTPGDPEAAREAYDRGRRKLQERRIAPRNTYDAWKAFTEARRDLEGLEPRPPLYDEVAQLIKDCERDLERDCNHLLFSAARFEKYGEDDKAQKMYREVMNHFPGEDPSNCRKKAQANIVSASASDDSK